MAVGIFTAKAVAQLLGSFLFGIQPTNPPTYVGVSLLLALVACLAPALRAVRVDPNVALRHE